MIRVDEEEQKGGGAGEDRSVFFYSSCVSDIRESPSDCSSDAGLNTSLHVCIKTHTDHL